MQPPALGGHCRLKTPILQKPSWSRMAQSSQARHVFLISGKISLVLQLSGNKVAPAPDWKNWAEVPGETPWRSKFQGMSGDAEPRGVSVGSSHLQARHPSRVEQHPSFLLSLCQGARERMSRRGFYGADNPVWCWSCSRSC